MTATLAAVASTVTAITRRTLAVMPMAQGVIAAAAAIGIADIALLAAIPAASFLS
jgi:hypothetical protein